MSEDVGGSYSEHNRELAETMVAVGTAVSQALAGRAGEEHVFLLQGANTVALPRLAVVTADVEGKKHGDQIGFLDLSVLVPLIFERPGTFLLEELVDAYLADEKLAQEHRLSKAQVIDSIMGVLIMSQAASPLEVIVQYSATWQSRSIIPTSMAVDHDDPMVSRVLLTARANPSGSLWDLFDTLVEGTETGEQTERIRQDMSRALRTILREGLATVNVPAALYNQ